MAKATAFNIQETQDFDAVRDLAHRIWPLCYAHVLSPDQIQNMLARIYDIAALHAEAAAGHRFFLAQGQGEPVGYASAYAEGEVAWLKKLYVLPTCRGTGLGKQLLDTTLAVFPQAKQQRLLVNPKNDAACRFYEHLGFAYVGEMPVMMGDHAFTDKIYARPCA